MTWLVKAVLTEEDKRYLKYIALELSEIRKLIEKIAETLVNLSDKELMKNLNVKDEYLKEKQVDDYKETLDKQVDFVEREFRS